MLPQSILQILLLMVLPTLVAAIIYPYLAAAKDDIQIESNGKYDSLKQLWHNNNGYIRALVFGCLSFAYCNQGWHLDKVTWGIVSQVSYCLLTCCIFWVAFDTRLNKLRGLKVTYVSTQKDAALSDRFIVYIDNQADSLDLAEASQVVKITALVVSAGMYLVSLFYLLW